MVPTYFEYVPPTPTEVKNHFKPFVGEQDNKVGSVYEHLARMDEEIRHTIDLKRKRTPKDLDFEDTTPNDLVYVLGKIVSFIAPSQVGID